MERSDGMESYRRLIDTVKGKRCALLGMGVSNSPLAVLLVRLGVCGSITVYDKKAPEELGELAMTLKKKGIEFVSGEDCFDSIDADVIFRSPGIRPDICGIVKAVERGALLTSEMEMFLETTRANVFAVTGSDGKTTTTTLTGKFLASNGRAFIGGNIGRPLLDRCHEMERGNAAVLELSSFQLMGMKRSPAFVAITNVTPNHLDWHTDLEEYARAKFNIIGEQTRRVVLNANDPTTAELGRRLIEEGGREVFFFSSTARSYYDVMSEERRDVAVVFAKNGNIYISNGKSNEMLMEVSFIRLPGKHNLENYMTAMALTYGYVEKGVYAEVAKRFSGVEHRLEPVRRLKGVDYYNSSIDSSPTRTAAALSALEGRDVVVICGGYDKNLDYTPLAPVLCKHARAVVLTGATAPKIKAALLGYEGYSEKRLKLVEADRFEDAVTQAAALAHTGGCVLLSPASASFDRFKSFVERGRYFKKLVNEL